MNTCNLCNKTFKFNYLLLKHQNRKNSCILNNNGDLKIAKKHYDYQVNKIYKLNKKTTDTMCGYCKKTFATKFNVLKHISNTCNIKTKEEEKKNRLKNIYDAMYIQQLKFNEQNKNNLHLTEEDNIILNCIINEVNKDDNLLQNITEQVNKELQNLQN